MTNKEIARVFLKLGKLMELHGESPFKTRAYDNAYRILRGYAEPVIDLQVDRLMEIQGIGKAIAEKIEEWRETGQLKTLNKYLDITPPGVQDMLEIKGLGPKKIYQIWQQLGVESVGELLYACNENRLVALKGFGEKSQQDIAAKAKFFLDSLGFMHYAVAKGAGDLLMETLKKSFPEHKFSFCGALRRASNVVEQLSIVGTLSADTIGSVFDEGTLLIARDAVLCGSFKGYKCHYHVSSLETWGFDLWRLTAEEAFIQHFEKEHTLSREIDAEEQVFQSLGIPFIIPERREMKLLEYEDLLFGKSTLQGNQVKGILHAHTTYSDGAATPEALAAFCQENGYEYLGITDHSKSAFYANGLESDRVKKQWDHIDQLNAVNPTFRIFKGIESDILNDGELDYEEDILKGFDFVIASIHSNLRMDEEKATQRLIRAIENPYTTILGHPTGRLLLSRSGYPIQHKKVIDAAAANGVAIEINSNPYRLDLDWEWIPYALSKGVKLSINPDAHSLQGIFDVQWGIPVAVKGGADAENLLCCMNLDEFSLFLNTK